MYTVNTNVVITALNAADPTSHRDQASTGTVSWRCGRVRPASAEEGEVMTLTVGTDRGPGADISVSGENRSSLRLRSAAGSASMVRSASMVPPAGSSIGGQPQKGATVMTTWRTRPTRQVQALREDLHAAGYTVDHLTELVGPEAIAAMAREQVVPAVRRARTLTDPAAVLARLFILGDQVTPAELATALPRSAGYAGELGLLTTTTGGTVQALLDLRPVDLGTGALYLAADLGEATTGHAVQAEHVLGLGGASRTLAELTVPTPAARALDLGTGSGVQALALAGRCAAVTGTDISTRALTYAALNADLNGLDLDLRKGDRKSVV